MVCYITFFVSGNQGFLEKVCDRDLDCRIKVVGVFVTVIESTLATFDHDSVHY
jgi:hypothetical protein